jgi:membrane protein
MIESASRHSGGGLAGIVGAVTLLAGATSVFVGLRTALNRMWDAHPQRASGMLAWIRGQALSFAMVLAVGFLLLVSLVLSAALSALQRFVEGGIEVPFAVQAANLLTSLAVITLLFATIYKYLPDTQISWSDVGVGAFATAVLFTIGKFLIGEYLGNSSLASTYGAAGSLVVLLVWVYYSAQIVLFGAEFTHVWAVRRGSRCGEERSER